MPHRTRTPLTAAFSALLLPFVLAMIPSLLPAQTKAQRSAAERGADALRDAVGSGATVDRSIARAQATFVENRGQWDSRALFMMQTPGLETWVTGDGMVLDLHRTVDEERAGRSNVGATMFDDHSLAAAREGQVVRMRFANAEAQVQPMALDTLPGRSNYFIGNDSSRWATDVQRHRRVRIDRMYPGIDAVYYVEDGRPRYDLAIAAGADPSQIRMEFEGADTVRVTADGTLLIGTSVGELQQSGLLAYQRNGSEQRAIACSFSVDADGRVRFEVGHYDRSRPLVIDPLVWSSYIGASGDDRGHEIAIDSAGTMYIAGPTNSPAFPTTTGAYKRTLGSDSPDIFIAKIDPSNGSGPRLVYSTYFGGNGDDAVAGITINRHGDVFACGNTSSTDFPTTAGALGATATPNGNAYVIQLDPSAGGVAQLVYSTYVGGDGQDLCYADAIDDDGNIYVTGLTSSPDFPTTSGAFGAALRGNNDVYVMKIDPTKVGAEQIAYSTLIGGYGDEVAFAVVANHDGTISIAGSTGGGAPGFPTTSGAFDADTLGGTDVFVATLDPSKNGSASLAFATIFGGSGEDEARGLVVGYDGIITVNGFTASPDLPTSSDAYDNSLDGTYDVFLARFDPTRTGNSQLLYSTYLGGAGEDRANINDLAIDSIGAVYVAGYTGSADFPTTPGAYDTTLNGSFDGFVAKLDLRNRPSDQMLYSTFLGGDAVDWLSSIVVDDRSNAFVVGQTSSSNYPVTDGALNVTTGGDWDAVATELAIPAIDLRAPNGGEAWCAGSTQQIRWSSFTVGDVKIEFSTDGGTTWNTIVGATSAASGSYGWDLPETGAASCRVRITPVEPSAIRETSDSDFAITTLVIVRDPSSQTVHAGETVTFTAEATGTPTPSVRWQRSTDGGGNFSDIAGATSPSYSVVASADDDASQYRALFSNGCVAPTAAATLTVQGSSGVTRTATPASTLAVSARPNPVHGDAIAIDFTLPTESQAHLSMIDVHGTAVIDHLELPRMPAGEHQWTLDVSALPSGTFVVIVSTGTASASVPVTLIR